MKKQNRKGTLAYGILSFTEGVLVLLKRFWKEEDRIKRLFLVNFFLCFITFLFVPIGSMYMRDSMQLTITQIGFLLGIPSIICCFFGSLSFFAYRILGTYKSLMLAFFLDIIVYIALLYKGSFNFIIIFFVLKGISSCISIPIFKNLYINALNNQDNRQVVFKINYILICTAAVFAPYVSRTIYPLSPKVVFLLIISLIFLSSFFVTCLKNFIEKIEVKKKEINALALILQKKSYAIFLGGCIGVLSVFSQFEGTFILTLKKDALNIFSELLILNSVFGIVIQLINIKFFKKISAFNSILLGCLFFALAYCSFMLFPGEYPYLLVYIVLFTLGETFVLPNIDIFVTEISNRENRILIYSLLEFKRFGFFLGPFVSGFIMQRISVNFMFLFFGSLSLVSAFVFSVFKKRLALEGSL